MINKQVKSQRLPIIFAAGVLSSGLLLSACSNNDNIETEATVETNNAAAVVEDSENDAAAQVETLDDDAAGDAQIADATDTDTDTDLENIENETTITSDNINPMTSTDKQPSLVTNPTQAGTPEDTVKQALDSLYYGDAKKSASYYEVDMANFEQELANTQSAFQQTVDAVTITDTTYNDDKTRATITGELMLKGQSAPAPLTYELQKIDGKWKILG
ncbi:hypothetical protein [Psychrobacter sp. H8-1]|uniref:hypothetical protein n=1 Tax=Psychrobacter sp. H8-1 TaxID=2774129 RepID=UPI00191B1834|nr:hypothetical protein [Psychrobacter sp. H8-1]